MIRALIIDDEKNALDVLKIQLQNYCPEVELVATCLGGEVGVQTIKRLNPDLVFLDIEMPIINGFDVLEATKELNYKIVFTTAYDQFAIKAFKYSAVDYLLKPIDIEELKAAVIKINLNPNYKLDHMFDQLQHYLSINAVQGLKIGLPFQGGYEMVQFSDIIRCESESNYTTIYLSDKRKVIMSKTLKEIEESINHPNFIRVHHSHFINIDHIDKVYKSDGGYIVMSDGVQVSISRAKKDDFFRILNKV